jgi:hypothetical protein
MLERRGLRVAPRSGLVVASSEMARRRSRSALSGGVGGRSPVLGILVRSRAVAAMVGLAGVVAEGTVAELG